MLKTYWDRVREHSPLVECFANIVTANVCANLLLACGASPVMADDAAGSLEFTRIAEALSLNIGTFTPNLQQTMQNAMVLAKSRNIPVVLDPVGAGCAASRTELAEQLLKLGVSIIRCNSSEANALLFKKTSTRGVDASAEDAVKDDNLEAARKNVVALARKYNCIAAVTGAIDLVGTPDGRCAIIRNGHAMMPRVTGSGCMLSTLVAAGAAANPSQLFEAVISVITAFGVAGEIAAENLAPGEGCGTFGVRLLDAAGEMNGEILERRGKYEII